MWRRQIQLNQRCMPFIVIFLFFIKNCDLIKREFPLKCSIQLSRLVNDWWWRGQTTGAISTTFWSLIVLYKNTVCYRKHILFKIRQDKYGSSQVKYHAPLMGRKWCFILLKPHRYMVRYHEKQFPCLRSMYNKSKQQFSLFYKALNVIIVVRVIDEYS